MTSSERERYARQIVFPPLGEEGQEKLLAAKVAIVGCGALGTVQASVLARAGVGNIRIIDRDYVELGNLQRQWLFEESDAAEALPKAIAAAKAIGRANSGVKVEPVVADLTPANISDLFEDVQLILDATDNFETRYLINDYSIAHSIPWIYGAAVGSYGITMPILPEQTACLRCIYPDPPTGRQPTCETAGVLGPLTSVIGSLQAAAAIKLLSGNTVEPRITTFDVWAGTTRQVSMPERDADCPTCGQNDFVHLDGSKRPPISLCGRNAVQIHERARPLNLAELAGELSKLGSVRYNEFALRFFTDPFEMTIFPDGRAIIKGTQDVGVARSLYARYVGA